MHKNNKDITARPTEQPPGHTRQVARERKEKALTEERALAREKKTRSAGHDSVLEGDGNLQAMKKIKMEGLMSVVAKNKVDAIVSQIDVMQRMKDVYVKMMGQEKYDAQIVHLMNQMPGMETTTGPILRTPTTEGTDVSTLDNEF